MILLTGVTGKVGDATARALAAKGAELRAIVRDADKAAPLAELGVEILVGDLQDADLVRKAMTGAEKALIVLPNTEHQEAMEKQFTDLAVAAHLKHLVKISSMESSADATVPIPQVHWRLEEYIRAADVPSTIIRPTFFMQNLLGSGTTIKGQGQLLLPMADAVTAMGDSRDVGDVVAEVMTGSGHEGKSYEITGPAVMTFAEVAACFSEVLGKPVEYVDQDPEDFREIMAQFLDDDWHLDAVCKEFALLAAGGQEYVTDTYKEIVGREPTSLRQFIQDFRQVFQD